MGKEPRPVNELMSIVRKVGGDKTDRTRVLSPALLARLRYA